MLSACITDTVAAKIQCCDCLQRLSSWPTGKARTISLLLGSLSMQQPDAQHLQPRFRLPVDPVL